MAYNQVGEGLYQDPKTGKVYRKKVRSTGIGQFETTDEYEATNSARAGQIERQFRYNNQFNRDMARYDAESMKYRDQLLAMFGQNVDVATGLAQRGTQAGVNQFLARRGIDARRGGLGASLMATAQGQLQGQGAQAKTNFSAQLAQAQAQWRDDFTKREFAYFQHLEQMQIQADIQRDLMRFQAELQKDQAKWAAFGDVLKLGGAALLTIGTGGAAAPAAAAMLGQSTGAMGPAGTQASEYGIG
jgi:hypothetical protein